MCIHQVLNVLEHLYDNPGAAPRRLLARLLYGRDSVFARIPTPAQVTSITCADVASHLDTWQRPDAAVLGIAGSLLPHLGQWQKPYAAHFVMYNQLKTTSGVTHFLKQQGPHIIGCSTHQMHSHEHVNDNWTHIAI